MQFFRHDSRNLGAIHLPVPVLVRMLQSLITPKLSPNFSGHVGHDRAAAERGRAAGRALQAVGVREVAGGPQGTADPSALSPGHRLAAQETGNNI